MTSPFLMLCILLFFAFLAQKIEDKDWSANQGCKDCVGKPFLRYIAGKEQVVQKEGDCKTKRSVKDAPEVLQLGNKQGYDRVDCISAERQQAERNVRKTLVERGNIRQHGINESSCLIDIQNRDKGHPRGGNAVAYRQIIKGDGVDQIDDQD